MESRIPQQYAEKYIKGGKATVVFSNTLTGTQKKFTVLAAYRGRNNRRSEVTGYFVYEYGERGWLVRINLANQLFTNPVLTELKDDVWQLKYMPAAKLAGNFNWMWKQIVAKTVPDTIHILHLGHCSVCGKLLTDAESIERGIGPYCAGLK